MYDSDIASAIALLCGLVIILFSSQILLLGTVRPVIRMLALVPLVLTLARIILPPLGAGDLAVAILESAHIVTWAAVPAVFRKQMAETPPPVARQLLIWAGLTLVACGAPIISLTGWPALATMVAIVLVIIMGLLDLEEIVRRAGSELNWIIKHAAIGLGAMLSLNLFIYADAMLLRRTNLEWLSARSAAYCLCIPLLMATAIRLQGYRRQIRLSLKGTYRSVLISLVGLYFLVMAACGYAIRELGTRWDTELEVFFTFGAVLVLPMVLGSAMLRAKLRVMLSKHFFTYRYDYREEWLRFIRTVSDSTDSGSLKLRLIKAVANICEATGGAIWIHNPEDHAYLPEENWNMGSQRLPALGQDTSLPTFLRRSGWIVDIEEYKTNPGRYMGLELPEWLLTHQRAWIVLPLIAKDEMVGFIVFGEPRVRQRLHWEDFDILKTVGHHVASYVTEENLLRDLSDARRLEAFNRRFAFVIHDIKNVIGQLSLMVRNAGRFGKSGEFQEDMIATVANAVDRLTHLMQQIRTESATLSDGSTGPAVSLLGLAGEIEKSEAAIPEERRITDILAPLVHRWQLQEPRFAAELDEAGDTTTTASPENICSVLDHLLQNAVEAIDAKGHVCLYASSRENEIVMTVADNGPGIDPRFIQEKLFRPLVSGKTDGFGLGAFQCRELVRTMGGRLEFDSNPGLGTRVEVVIPKQTKNAPFKPSENSAVQ